jgi:tripartite ATP-independent transporter DctM subunit
VPGVLMAVTMMLMVAWFAHKNKYPREPFPTFKIALRNFGDAFLPLMAPVILLGGIWTGVFTPTEASAVAVVYALVLGGLIYKELKWKDLKQVFIETARDTAVIGFVVACSSFYGWILMRSGFTIKFAELLLSITRDPVMLLLLINAFLLVVGCFLDTTVAILILGPILMQVIVPVGIDPVHFGVMMVLNLMIGLLTPPFGIVLFVMAQVSGLKFDEIVKACLPFYIPLFVVLGLIIFVPGVVTFLPNLLMGK